MKIKNRILFTSLIAALFSLDAGAVQVLDLTQNHLAPEAGKQLWTEADSKVAVTSPGQPTLVDPYRGEIRFVYEDLSASNAMVIEDFISVPAMASDDSVIAVSLDESGSNLVATSIIGFNASPYVTAQGLDGKTVVAWAMSDAMKVVSFINTQCASSPDDDTSVSTGGFGNGVASPNIHRYGTEVFCQVTLEIDGVAYARVDNVPMGPEHSVQVIAYGSENADVTPSLVVLANGVQLANADPADAADAFSIADRHFWQNQDNNFGQIAVYGTGETHTGIWTTMTQAGPRWRLLANGTGSPCGELSFDALEVTRDGSDLLINELGDLGWISSADGVAVSLNDGPGGALTSVGTFDQLVQSNCL